MAEYIEREKAIAEIDKGDLLVGDNAKWAKEMLYRTPTADVVPVVRCKDCEYFFPQVGFNSCEKYSENHTHYIVTVDENDYCSKGERKDSND